MSTIEHSQTEIPAPAAAPGSLLAAIQEQQKDAASSQTVDIPIAGYKRPQLVARYRFLEHDESLEIGKAIRENPEFTNDIERAEAGLLATMIEACIGLFAREGDKLEPVDPDGGGPCRYDDRLENFFGQPPSYSSRETVVRAFKGNWLAAINHGRVLSEWLGDTTQTIEKLLGEA